MGQITEKAKWILNKFFKENLTQPASLSERFHKGETMREHLEAAAKTMEILCDGMGIKEEDRDLLIAAAYLHDIGKFIIGCKGKVEQDGWTYFEATDWSRQDDYMCIHPFLSAAVLERFKIPRKEELQRLVSIHMGPRYKRTPKPEGLYETLVVLADYMSYRVYEAFKQGETK